MSKSRNWSCPYCNRAQTLTEPQIHDFSVDLDLAEHRYQGEKIALKVRLSGRALACANTECGEITLNVEILNGRYDEYRRFCKIRQLSIHKLRPESLSKPQPDCIPVPLREDYYEACLIRDKSPKASATLTRRVLQGMIREFCKIKKSRLFDEIEALKELDKANTLPKGVTSETIDAIDHVRKIGNIGAHMEQDINVIVPVDPGEAQALIDLIELLFDEWYVARDVRQTKLAKIKHIAEEKDQKRKADKPKPDKNQKPDI